MKLRIATPNDAAAVLSIYSQYIHTPVTFEYELPPQEEFARRIGDTLKRYPYLVCADSGRLCGYAYAHRFGERAAYQWSAELSIYLDAGATARGIGRTLYSALIELLRRQGIRTGNHTIFKQLYPRPGDSVSPRLLPHKTPAVPP